jgi:quercetin dioxygenase-like cupin family protein
MKGKFLAEGEREVDRLDWGDMGWISRPSTTGAKEIVVIDVTLEPGFGHDFHKHPDQEEVIYVRAGRIEQWVERDSKHLEPGDAVFIQKDIVHASFNTGTKTAQLTVVLGPCVGDEGYALVDVSAEEPWASLREKSPV